MERPSWNSIFMKMTETVATRSTCERIKTGALLVKDERVISIGYNGVVSGADHCDEHWRSYWASSEHKSMKYEDFVKNILPELHHPWSLINEIHGEQNAILYAAKEGIPTKETELYSLYSPCINCAKVIISAGIQKVYYRNMYYRDDLKGITFLQGRGIECIRL